MVALTFGLFLDLSEALGYPPERLLSHSGDEDPAACYDPQRVIELLAPAIVVAGLTIEARGNVAAMLAECALLAVAETVARASATTTSMWAQARAERPDPPGGQTLRSMRVQLAALGTEAHAALLLMPLSTALVFLDGCAIEAYLRELEEALKPNR
ncbi:MAG: hypothetical protein AAGF99_05135 [Bacteroidota bacterium]